MKKIRVLVAEDDEVNAKAARMMLEQLGCRWTSQPMERKRWSTFVIATMI